MNVTIIADASRCPQTGASGYGYWIACARMKIPGGGFMREATDSASAAEAMAVVNAVHGGLRRMAILSGDSVLIQTDCVAAIQLFRYERIAATKDEKKAQVALASIRVKNKLTLRYKHVKGHTGRAEARFVTNHLCDARAKEGMRFMRRRLGYKK